jgi:hypothetical protein
MVTLGAADTADVVCPAASHFDQLGGSPIRNRARLKQVLVRLLRQRTQSRNRICGWKDVGLAKLDVLDLAVDDRVFLVEKPLSG